MAKKSALDKLNNKLAVSENNIEPQPDETAAKPRKEKPTKPPKPPKPPKQPKQRKEKNKSAPAKPKKASVLDKIPAPIDHIVEGPAVNTPSTVQQNDGVKNQIETEKSGFSVRTHDVEAMPDIDYQSYERELNTADMMETRKAKKVERRRYILTRIGSAALIVACLYIVFLIYGALNTSYVYNEQGKVVPQTLSVQEIRELNEFNEFATQYRQARMVYEAVLTLDYRVGAGVEDPLVIAPEYEKLLESIEQLVINVQAMSVSSKYVQTNNMLLQWAQTDVAVYCQRMSEAISQNNAEYAAQALQYKTIMYNDFSIITSNLTTLGKTVEGAEIAELISWSPEKYVRENIG